MPVAARRRTRAIRGMQDQLSGAEALDQHGGICRGMSTGLRIACILSRASPAYAVHCCGPVLAASLTRAALTRKHRAVTLWHSRQRPRHAQAQWRPSHCVRRTSAPVLPDGPSSISLHPTQPGTRRLFRFICVASSPPNISPVDTAVDDERRPSESRSGSRGAGGDLGRFGCRGQAVGRVPGGTSVSWPRIDQTSDRPCVVTRPYSSL